jgi:hypothetical protein
MYILSLFYTEDTSRVEIIGEKLKINKNRCIYNIYARKIWKHLGLNEYYESITIKEDYYRNSNDPFDKIAQPKYTRNPFNTQEPKRTSSDKKIKKFIKHLNDVTFLKYDTNNFEMMLNECYLNELKDINEYYSYYSAYDSYCYVYYSYFYHYLLSY